MNRPTRRKKRISLSGNLPVFVPKVPVDFGADPEWGNQTPRSIQTKKLGRTALITGSTVLIFAAAYSLWQTSTPSRSAVLAKLESEEASIEHAEFRANAERLIRQLYSSTTIEEIVKCIANDADIDLLRLHFGDGPIAPANVSWIAPLAKRYAGDGPNGGEMILLDYRLEGNETSRTAAVEHIGDRFAIDWQSLVHFEPVPLESFLDGEAAGPATFRVILQKDDYFNFKFSDDERYDCYRMRTSRRGDWIYCYAEKASYAGQQLARLIERAEDRDSPTLRPTLSFAPPDQPPRGPAQLEIGAVVSSDWILR